MNRTWHPYAVIFVLFVLAAGGLSVWVCADVTPAKLYPPGDPANPLSFMSASQWAKAETFSRIKEAIYFAGMGYEWLVYLMFLVLGLASAWRTLAQRVGRPLFLQVAVYTALFLLFLTLLNLPVRYASYWVSRQFGMSNQLLPAWLADVGKGWLVSWLMLVPLVWLGYLVVRKSPRRWWFWFWLASIPLFFFFVYVQPVLVDPLFNRFQPLQDQALKADILALAHQADIPAHQVYEVDMSSKTNALNAYVAGIGPSARIVLWDTTLKKLSHDEILFIMGHEMGHYVMHHIFWGMAFSLGGLLFLLWLLSRLMPRLIRRYGKRWGISSLADLSSLPLVMLLISLLSFAVSPLQNAVSRQLEHAADVYGLHITGKADAAIRAFQKLAAESLSDPNPPTVVRFFLYDHPTLSERIAFVEQTARQKENP